ncbi:N-acetyltransferase [Parasedimentitalea marina]|uniref:N-acetyltransferase n=1 Tax=Parasedimentitalea marina TaxID=2483033 RepID=A0A3T0N6S1_9RHOB|nr:GNAT family protein [Parasedimentitalea marina]AZV79671.1 N-acetyltransferase [Parasedimentitalea marina]
MWAKPVTLKGNIATLAPLDQSHAADLAEASADGALHQLWYTTVPSPNDVPAEITRRLTLCDQGTMIPFAILDASGRAVGMTTYMNIDHSNRRLEIGSTWYRKSVQRTGLNTECKWLMLHHAFETLNAIAVEFRTHVINVQSRRAIERLGAKQDGILRAHMILSNGTLRDTAVYSITATDWPTTKAHLNFQRQRHRADSK